MTLEKIKNAILKEVSFSKLEKNKGIYEFFKHGDNSKSFNPENLSLGISYEDIDNEKDIYIYNIFAGEEYININAKGTKENPIPNEVLKELTETWNSLED